MIAGISRARTTKVSRRTPIATVAPIWISSSSGSRVSVAKVPARIRPAPVTTPPVATSARSVPSRGAVDAAASSRTRVIRKML